MKEDDRRTRFQKLFVQEIITTKDALRQMGLGGEKILFVLDQKEKLIGTLTDGDIRRWILSEGSLGEKISKVFNKKPKILLPGYDLSSVRETMLKEKLEAIPVIGPEGKITDVLFWSDVFSDGTQPEMKELRRVPVLIMAGGKGTRLDPLTKIFPKPLIPFGDKPIIEYILDRFSAFGCDDFFLSVNYKGKMIQTYFEQPESKYKITFLWENEPTGTAGSLRQAVKLIKGSDLFVSNCDILIKADYADIYDYHLRHDNDITIVGSMQHLAVPYGVLHLKKEGLLDDIVEKPEYDFLVNTGFYVVKKQMVKHIPSDIPFDFPHLIKEVKNAGGSVRVYPISQDAWTDIGQLQEYKNALCHLEPGSLHQFINE